MRCLSDTVDRRADAEYALRVGNSYRCFIGRRRDRGMPMGVGREGIDCNHEPLMIGKLLFNLLSIMYWSFGELPICDMGACDVGVLFHSAQK